MRHTMYSKRFIKVTDLDKKLDKRLISAVEKPKSLTYRGKPRKISLPPKVEPKINIKCKKPKPESKILAKKLKKDPKPEKPEQPPIFQQIF